MFKLFKSPRKSHQISDDNDKLITDAAPNVITLAQSVKSMLREPNTFILADLITYANRIRFLGHKDKIFTGFYPKTNYALKCGPTKFFQIDDINTKIGTSAVLFENHMNIIFAFNTAIVKLTDLHRKYLAIDEYNDVLMEIISQ